MSDVVLQDVVEPAFDVVVIGAGLAGTSAATVLANAGHRVALVDFHAVHQNEFRAEKLGSYHMSLFEKLGLGETVKRIVTPMDDILVYRFGRLFARESRREYGFSYGDLINGLRAAVPDPVTSIVSKVTEIVAGPCGQRVVLADGKVLDTRLVVVATGLSDAVRRLVGVRRLENSKAHSLSIGFNLAGTCESYPFETLTYYGRHVKDRVAYLTLFPIGKTMRANFFVYRQASEPWTKEFRLNPQRILCEMMPEIAAQCGNFAVDGPVAIRPIDLMTSEGHERDGVVLIGDAFCTTCPAPGVGIQRVMTDVDRLCNVYIPQWLQTPGMDAAKITAFYRDEIKVAMDKRGIGSSYYARDITTRDVLLWRMRRLRNGVVRGLLLATRQIRARLQKRGPEDRNLGMSM